MEGKMSERDFIAKCWAAGFLALLNVAMLTMGFPWLINSQVDGAIGLAFVMVGLFATADYLFIKYVWLRGNDDEEV
jgi:hypothetical protein